MEKRVILIAGAGKGIGLKTAEFLSADHHLITISRNLTPELAALNTEFIAFDAKENTDALPEIPEVLHGLVYCPGSINLKPFNRLTLKDFQDDFNQNVLGAVNLIQKYLPAMKRAGGASIVLFSTVAVGTGMPFHASIAAAKGGLEALARSLAAEFASLNIRVNVIAPSLTDTTLAGNLLSTPEKREAASKRHPLQRIGTTDDMAQAVKFLTSENAGWITGQVLGIDGGLGKLKM
jgi:NAD(P)-dependent dehydrogenase (short-subunit alcohol dehydrogenase family)